MDKQSRQIQGLFNKFFEDNPTRKPIGYEKVNAFPNGIKWSVDISTNGGPLTPNISFAYDPSSRQQRLGYFKSKNVRMTDVPQQLITLPDYLKTIFPVITQQSRQAALRRQQDDKKRPITLEDLLSLFTFDTQRGGGGGRAHTTLQKQQQQGPKNKQQTQRKSS
jgi:hypothetical protein